MIALVLAATLLVTPEQPVSVARQGVVGADYLSTHSASNGETLLVVWNDARGPQAARYDATGRRLDEQSIGLPLANSAWEVLWNGDHWVVLNPEFFVRVDADGKLLDRTQRPLGLGLDRLSGFRAVWAGSVALIVTAGDRGRDLMVWRLDRDMRLIDRIDLTPYPPRNRTMSLVGLEANGSSAVLFYSDSETKDLHAALFDRFGQLDRDRVMARHRWAVSYGATGSDGSGYALIYRPNPFEPVWVGFTLDADFDRDGIRSFALAESMELRDLVFDGTTWTAYFARLLSGRMEVDAVRIAPDGSVSEPEAAFSYALPEYNVGEPPHVAAVGGTTLAFYREDGPKERPVAKVRNAASVSDLAIGILPQVAPASAAGATQSLVAWREELAPGDIPTIFATRVDAGGRVLDPQSLVLGGTTCRANMVAASAGDDFLVVWRDTAAIAGAIVRADGTAQPVRIFDGDSCSYLPLAVASNGSTYLVVWATAGEFADRVTMSMTRVASDGTVLDAEPLTFNSKAKVPLVATDGRDFLVVTGDESRRVTADGVLLDRRGVELEGTALAVWWNGSEYVIAERGEEDIAGTPHCDDRGCTFASFADGAWRIARVEKSGIRVQTIAAVGSPEDVSIAGSFLVYSRRVPELGNASRVFLSRIATMRGRAVRH